jgi:rfaE bifunctional protein nucleotidyltransferase chain/domain
MGIIVRDLKLLSDNIENAKCFNKKIVFGNGCFELIHVGHIRYFKKAKSLGDILVIAVNDDSTLLGLGKRNKIITPLNERLEILAAFKDIDYVTVMTDSTADKLLLLLKPDINVKGPDYTQDKVLERETIKSYGGKTVILSGDKKHSTSNIIKEIMVV